jgi:hypothetical protein
MMLSRHRSKDFVSHIRPISPRTLSKALSCIVFAALCLVGASAAPANIPIFPESGTGWDISCASIASEDFSTPVRLTGPECVIAEGGVLETKGAIAGAASLRGSSTGAQGYLHYFNTRPEKLPLRGGATYRLTLSYRIVEAEDKGFEVMFYSPTGGSEGKWLPGSLLRGPVGKAGTVELEAKLFDFPDYQIWLNVVGHGAIVVDDIVVKQGGITVFAEDFERVVPGPGPGFRVAGGTVNSDGWLVLENGSILVTDPAITVIPSRGTFRISFDYRFLTAPVEETALDLRLLQSPSSKASVALRPLLGNAPATGHFSTGFTTGSLGPYAISVGAIGQARVLIDNIVIEKGEVRAFADEPASYAYLNDAPFPRLGNYTMFSPTEQAQWGGFEGEAGAWKSSVDDLERRLALFDVIFGFAPRADVFDADFRNRIKKLNPNAVLLPYVLGQETNAYMHQLAGESPDPDGEAAFRYDRGLASSWYVRTTKGVPAGDPSYPGILKLDITPGSAIINGKNFLGYQVDSFKRDYFGSGIWDGLFIDNLFARMNSHIPDSWNPEKLDYDINRNGKRDETPAMLNRISYEGERILLEGLIAGTGNRELIMGNNGPLPETRFAPYVNGYVFEDFPYAWEGVGKDVRDPSEPGWRKAFDEYRVMDEYCRAPRINVVQAAGALTNYDIPGRGRAEPLPEDFRRNRFILGTTLLGDAFYEYDLTNNCSSVAWFDEFAVGPDGVARESFAGKGYLGHALGPAVELALPGSVAWQENFDGDSVPGGGKGSRLSRKSGEVIAGKGSMVIEGTTRRSDAWTSYDTRTVELKKGKTYVIEFSWKVLDDLDYGLWFSINGANGNSRAQLDALYSGELGRERLPFTAPADGSYTLHYEMLSAGRAAIDDIRITEGGAGPWRRDFENGIVLVNPYRTQALFDAEDVAGVLGRTGVRRIRGSQTPEINDGQPVTSGLSLGAFDAIILLADRKPRR